MGNHADKLSQNDVHFLNMITNFKKEEIKTFYKDFVKQWPDGYMELQTFKDFLQGFFQEKDCNFAEHYFRNIDKDNSGKINFREFLLYLSAERSSNPSDRITWLFDLFDIDGSGFIDRKEMVEMFKSALKMTKEDTETGPSPEKLTDDIFERYDKDRNNAMEKHEFQNAILEKPYLFTIFPVLYDKIFKSSIE